MRQIRSQTCFYIHLCHWLTVSLASTHPSLYLSVILYFIYFWIILLFFPNFRLSIHCYFLLFAFFPFLLIAQSSSITFYWFHQLFYLNPWFHTPIQKNNGVSYYFSAPVFICFWFLLTFICLICLALLNYPIIFYLG